MLILLTILKIRRGQIVTVKVPNSTGCNNLRLNVGETKNWGYETDVKVFTLSGNLEYRGGHVMYSDLGRKMTFTGSGGWTSQRDNFVVPNSVYRDGALH